MWKLGSLLALLPLLLVSVQGDCRVPTYPPDRRVMQSTIAVKAMITAKSQHTAELWVLYVYKGKEKLSGYEGMNTKLADFNLKDIRLNISVDGDCTGLEEVQYKQEYIILLRSKGGHLELDSTPGSIIAFSASLDRRIFKLLGWDEWSDWTSCTSVCSGGLQRRERKCRTGVCHGHSKEQRSCNKFPCTGLINLLSIENPHFFKPSRSAFRSIPGHGSGWRLKSSSYLLYPFLDAFGSNFPRQFSLFLNFRPYTGTQGVLLSLTNPKNKAEFLSLELTTITGNDKLELKLVHSSLNGTRVVAIPTDTQYNAWNYLAISIGEESTVKTYLNCRWVTTQILHGYPLLADPTPDVAIGYLFQGEIEQVSVSVNPEDVSDQCSMNQIYTDPESEDVPQSVSDDDYMDEEVIELNKRADTLYALPQQAKKEQLGDTNHQHHDGHRHMTREDDVEEDDELHDDHDEAGSGQYVQHHEEEEDHAEGSGNGFAVEWSSWSPCSSSCGRATQTRVSRCMDSDRMMECIDAGLQRRVTKSCSLPPCRSLIEGHTHITSQDIQSIRERIFNTTQQFAQRNPVKEKPENTCGCSPNGRCDQKTSRCECTIGWTGTLCTEPVCTPACLKGKCVQPDVCACSSGYTGARCQTAFCHPLCQNGGECTSPFTCTCSTGYSGNYCQKQLCAGGCRNGGVCMGANLCSCPHGFSGSDCGDFTCSKKCLNGGVCTASDRCTCPKGYTGSTCEHRICRRFVKLREPVRQAYKRVEAISSKASAEVKPEYRTFYRTFYRTRYRCIEPEVNP